jgi:hypothetical protein
MRETIIELENDRMNGKMGYLPKPPPHHLTLIWMLPVDST